MLLICSALVAVAYVYLKVQGDKSAARQQEISQYDATAVRKVDPALIKYRQIAMLPTGLKEPTALALDAQDQIIIAGEKQLRILDGSGTLQKRIDLAADPQALAAGEDGTIYLAFADRVELYTPQGSKKGAWPTKFASLRSIAVLGDDVWLGEFGFKSKMVLHCDKTGKLLAELGKGDLLVPSPYLPVAAGSDGVVWVANPGKHRLQAYTRDGQLVAKWPDRAEVFYGCCNPVYLAVTPERNLVTGEKGSNRITLFGPDGKLKCFVADTAMLGDAPPAGLAVNRKGEVLVLDGVNGSVRVFAPKEGGNP